MSVLGKSGATDNDATPKESPKYKCFDAQSQGIALLVVATLVMLAGCSGGGGGGSW